MIEYRTISGGSVEAGGSLRGMVTPFGVETVIGDLKQGGFREEIAPGTFTKTLNERAVVLIHNHDTAMPMASTAVPEGEEGHLSLSQERDGFWANAPKPFETTYTANVRTVKKILGMSFGFQVTKDEWYDDEGRASTPQAGTKRVIREVKLHEVSTTAFPAYASTLGTVSARDAISAARGISEARAAKATYADLDTCGECGSENEYGAYCSNCGEPMQTSKPKGDYCTSCGQALDDSSRSSHRCESRDDAQDVASIDAILDEALKLLDGCDRNSLPPEANQAIDLLHGASKNLDGHMKDAGIPDPDENNGNSYNEAGSATSDDDERHQKDLAILRANLIDGHAL